MQHTLAHRSQRQSGQIGIIIILIMIVLLTIGIAVAGRTSTELALSQQEEESTRVFNAAEAGVETALSSNLSFSGDHFATTSSLTADNATINYTVDKNHVMEMRVPEGGVVRVQLKDTTTSTPPSVTLDWAKEGNCSPQTPASLIVSIYSQDTTQSPALIKVRHYAYAACAHSDGINVVGTAGQNGYFKEVTITLNSTDTMMRIKPFYSDTYVRVAPTSGSLPVETYSIRSTGKNTLGNETRIVTVNRSLPTAPSIFDYVLFSGTTIIK